MKDNVNYFIRSARECFEKIRSSNGGIIEDDEVYSAE